ncbi:MAG: Cell division protein ZapA [Paracidovorax wautersii]|uniref:Cell division protein ZapA n=1 Tax=Paracidovorax wautersii TaxID=1177982 RepID=A0A7V8FL82_9BURK|nr:MAG: Cell division protein ZapA [Paracidovorax wautersii]
MKQIEVQIMGQSYLLGCPEDGEERLRAAVEKVDSAMCAIRDHGKIRARDRIAVLAALNLAFDLADREASDTALRPATPAASAPLASSAAPVARPQSAAGAPVSAAHAAASASHAEPQLELLLTKLDQALSDPQS